MSCTKAQKYFEQKKITFSRQLDARKDPVKEAGFLKILSGIQQIYIGKGKKVICLTPGEDKPEEIAKHALGRTGNLRAPTIQNGNTLFVGYNESIYESL